MAYRNWHQKAQEQRTIGDRIADGVSIGMGSWRFIIIQTIIIAIWIGGNAWLLFHFDPFPFIFLNLAFSAQAAYATPIIMMSQNRAAARDKVQAEHQYEHQEKELALNTELTKQVHLLTQQIHELLERQKASER
ncbi:MAG TPA: DUF1003 domain-containing protein [Candidatus Saccharimonadales bacterium]|nr:DUF1003 domain-containing protein [Candidatus Saccharimonadales bacterium]